jgi:dTDP-4-amino-4,6-dideoxygalactose transaminase
MITTSSASLAGTLRELRNLGKRTKHEIAHVAPNTKLDTLQAAILRVKLRRLDGWNRRRRAIASRYRAALDGIGDLRLTHDPGGEGHVYHLFVVRTSRRDELRRHLAESGVRASVHYPVPPHLQPLDEDLGYREGAFPVAEECARTVLSLPVAPELTDDQVNHVCERIRKFFGA